MTKEEFRAWIPIVAASTVRPDALAWADGLRKHDAHLANMYVEINMMQAAIYSYAKKRMEGK
jgi:hypothetical protein